MRLMRCFPAAVVAVVATFAPMAAVAQEREFAFSLGFSNLSLDDPEGGLDGQGGNRFEPRYSWQPFDDQPQVRFGFALGFSYFYDESEGGQIIAPPFGFDVGNYEDVTLLTPEFQLSWREPLGEKWWLEGGVGVGPVFGFYSAGHVIFDEFIDEDVTENDVGFGVRPFVRAAWQGERWSWGLEGSYQWTTIDFGDPYGGNARDWYVGVFFGYGR
jgi:hypothetical protein